MDNLHKWIEEYLNYLEGEKEVSESTFKSYKTDLKQFEEYIKSEFNIDITEVKREHIVKYQAYMRTKKKWASKTRARKTIALKDFYNYISEKHNIDNPAETILIPKIEERKPVYLNEEEVQRLIDATKTQLEPYRSRDELILRLFISTGLRVAELTGIKLTDIKGKMLRVVGKRNKERLVALNKDVLKALKKYLNVRPNVSEYLFLSKNDKPITVRGVQYVVDKYLQLAGLDQKGYSVHTLRHTAATLILKGTKNMKLVQNVLGHVNIYTTQIYAHVDEDMLNDAASATEGKFK